MVYFINGAVVLLLLLFFAILSIEDHFAKITSTKKSLSGFIGNWRLHLKQMRRK